MKLPGTLLLLVLAVAPVPAALNSDLTRRKIENEMRKRLTEKGLTEVESKPDLNVRFTLGQARKTEVEAYPAGWRGLGASPTPRERWSSTCAIRIARNSSGAPLRRKRRTIPCRSPSTWRTWSGNRLTSIRPRQNSC
jgi:hypothetical protein